MTATNEIEALRRRVEDLEKITRPLLAADMAARSGDDAFLAALAGQVGVTVARLQGSERTRSVTAARRVIAQILATEAGWGIGRIARALRKDKATVSEMLRK